MRNSLLILLFIGTLLLIPGISSGQTHPREVQAVEGDGIHKLLARYGLDSAHYVQQFIELNKQKLGQQQWLYAGYWYLLPADPGVSGKPSASGQVSESSSAENTPAVQRVYDIFGPKYASVTVEENTLQGAVFYIVAGHGGPDPGAEGFRDGNQMCEDEYAYDVALRLCRELILRGAMVYLIIRDSTDGIRDDAYLLCDTDEYCSNGQSIPRHHVTRLKQRAEAVNTLFIENRQSKYQRMIELHIDSRHQGYRVDVFFYHHSKSPKGAKLAERIHAMFGAMYQKHQPDRGYQGSVSSRDELYMISKTLPPTVYIELGNIQNEEDQVRFIRWENRLALARWIAEGIEVDFKASQVP